MGRVWSVRAETGRTRIGNQDIPFRQGQRNLVDLIHDLPVHNQYNNVLVADKLGSAPVWNQIVVTDPLKLHHLFSPLTPKQDQYNIAVNETQLIVESSNSCCFLNGTQAGMSFNMKKITFHIGSGGL
jgi:hypothetical protein